jgi:protein-tyrosine phosphatase
MRLDEEMTRTVLFLCTGNYYRSRFAEVLFNARATATGLSWRAFSRGLALEKGVNNVGPISLDAMAALKKLGIMIPEGQRYPLQAEEHDFHTADLIIALKQAEHQPYIRDRYPAWAERVHYWHVHDRIPTLEYDPLKEIEHEIHHLILTLRQLSV